MATSVTPVSQLFARPEPQPRQRSFFELEEGWLSVFLLLAMVLSTVWSIDRARWAAAAGGRLRRAGTEHGGVRRAYRLVDRNRGHRAREQRQRHLLAVHRLRGLAARPDWRLGAAAAVRRGRGGAADGHRPGHEH